MESADILSVADPVYFYAGVGSVRFVDLIAGWEGLRLLNLEIETT